jgi:hypothetical protein
LIDVNVENSIKKEETRDANKNSLSMRDGERLSKKLSHSSSVFAKRKALIFDTNANANRGLDSLQGILESACWLYARKVEYLEIC